MERKRSPANRAFAALLELRHLSPREAAARLGLSYGTVSTYTSGQRTLSPEAYHEKCARLGIEPAMAEVVLDLASRAESDEQLRRRAANALAAEVGRLAESLAAPLPGKLRELAAEQERQALQALWSGLGHLSLAEWRLAAAAGPEIRRWGLVKLVGEESARRASVHAREALELADFALWLAERVPGEDAWASQVFAWAFVGNARRVGGDLKGAEAAFARSAHLRAERPEGLPDVPQPWRLLDLEASLRIGLRQLPEALRLLDEAVRLAPRTGSVQARLLCIRANALYRTGDLEGSITALQEALDQQNCEGEPGLLCILQFNLVDTLCSAGRTAEAAEMLPKLRRLQAQIGNGLNQIRLRWLEGKIDAGLGRLDQAIETLSWVRAAFAKEDIRYDEAQAGMELAGLYLKKGRTADVKRLALLMAPVFRTQGVPAEARKALALFRRAVEAESVTPELVGRLTAFLRRAQDDPELCFDAVA